MNKVKKVEMMIVYGLVIAVVSVSAVVSVRAHEEGGEKGKKVVIRDTVDGEKTVSNKTVACSLVRAELDAILEEKCAKIADKCRVVSNEIIDTEELTGIRWFPDHTAPIFGGYYKRQTIGFRCKRTGIIEGVTRVDSAREVNLEDKSKVRVPEIMGQLLQTLTDIDWD